MRIPSLLAAAGLVAASLLVTVGTASAAPAAPPLVISPDPAGPGDTVTFSGSGCFGQDANPAQVTLYVIDATVSTPDSTKKISAADDEGDPIVTPKPDGTWSYTLPIPDQIPSIDITFGAVCDTYSGSFQYGPATLTIAGNLDATTALFLPDFLYSKAVLDAGKSYAVEAFGFEPGEKVDLILHSAPVQIATFVVDGDSSVVGRFTLPLDTVGGAHTLEMVGEDSGLTAGLPIEVVAAAVAPTVTATAVSTSTVVSTVSTTLQATSAAGTTTSVIGVPVLASTGASAIPQMTGAGIALTLGGVGTLLFARRRRSRSH